MVFESNSYANKEISKIEQNENSLQEIRDIILKFFDDRSELENLGLVKKYKDLKEKVTTDNLIGLILWGSTRSNFSEEDNFINKYTNPVRKEIILTVTSICNFLIIDHIGIENVEALCKELE